MADVDTGTQPSGLGGGALDEELSHRRVSDGENRWPPAVAVMVAGVAYALLPGPLLFAPRVVLPAVEAVLLVALVVTNPRRLVRQTRWSRWASVTLSVVVIVANLVALGLLVAAVTRPDTSGGSLLVAAMQVWVTT